jgi:hypothetical protein
MEHQIPPLAHRLRLQGRIEKLESYVAELAFVQQQMLESITELAGIVNDHLEELTEAE